MMRRVLAPFLFAALVFPSIAAGQEGATVVVLVRHAEKAGPSGDVPLSEAGRARAEALAEALADAGVDAIVTTQFERTRSTAAPLSERLSLPVEVIPADWEGTEAHVAATTERILGAHRGRTVVVVGHSNTVPMIARALGAPKVPEIADPEYDNFWTVIVDAGGRARLIRGRYGASR